jgi:hypothetical protein
VLILIAGSFVWTQRRCAGQQSQPVLFQCDFQQIAPGPLPEEFKALRGEFTIKEEQGNRFVELEVHELNTFGVAIGPERGAETSLRARLRGWPSGKRFPEFGIGLGGTRGFQLWLMPAMGELQVRRDNRILARAPFNWRSGTWINMQIDIRSAGEGHWVVAGKAWLDTEKEPANGMVEHQFGEAPPNGQASLWGTPYSEKPIQFDDVCIEGK